MGFLSHFSSHLPHFYDVTLLIFGTLCPANFLGLYCNLWTFCRSFLWFLYPFCNMFDLYLKDQADRKWSIIVAGHNWPCLYYVVLFLYVSWRVTYLQTNINYYYATLFIVKDYFKKNYFLATFANWFWVAKKKASNSQQIKIKHALQSNQNSN